MRERPRQAHLTIGFDGDRVIGEVRDERGAVNAFSGWLDLISALEALRKRATSSAVQQPNTPAIAPARQALSHVKPKEKS